MTNAYPPKRSDKPFRQRLVPIPLAVSGVGNCVWWIFSLGTLVTFSRVWHQVHFFPLFRSVCTNFPRRLPVALFLFDFWLACLLLSVNQSDRCSLIIEKQVLLVIASFGNCHFSSHRIRPNYGLGRKSHWGAFCGEWSSGWRVHA